MSGIQDNLLHRDTNLGINPSSKSHKNWFKRTFSKLDNGGLRGNTFLMLVSTAGCSYFYLPYFAKVSGLYAMCIFLSISAFVSYYSSTKLYYAYKATKAKTFNECTEMILGSKLGFLANFMIFLHVYGTVLVTWAFGFKIFNHVLILNYPKLAEQSFQYPFGYVYFLSVFLIVFLFNFFGNLEKLKSISAIGLLIMIYLTLVYAFQMSDYFDYYNDKDRIAVEGFKIDNKVFATFGLSNCLFLNQYTIMPICKNINNVTSKRVTKVIGRALLSVFLVYLSILFIGYFSQPNQNVMDSGHMSTLFLLRTPIPGRADTWAMIGQALFGIFMLINLIVKSHFLIIYFEELLRNIGKITSNRNLTRERIIDDEIDVMRFKNRRTSSENEVNSPESLQESLQQQMESFSESTAIIDNEEQNDCKRIANGFIFLFISAFISYAVVDMLSKFLTIVYNFVAIFEMVVFPLWMICEINKRKKILGDNEKVIIFLFAGVYVCVCVSVLFANLFLESLG